MNYSEDAILIRGNVKGHRWTIAQVLAGVVFMLIGGLLDISSGWFALIVFVFGATIVVGSILLLAIRYGDRKALLIVSSLELVDTRRTSSQEFFEWSDIANIRQQRNSETNEIVGLIIEMKSASDEVSAEDEEDENKRERHSLDLRGLEIPPNIAAEVIVAQFQKQRS